MKNPRTCLLGLLLIFFNICSSVIAQNAPYREPDYNKPKFFDAYPSIIPITTDQLDDLLSSRQNQTISKALAADNHTFPFEGKVMSELNKEDGSLKRVMIKSTNYPDATLTVWKYIDADGILRYQARIISFTHGDAYVLEKTSGGYALVKKGFYDLVNE